MGEPQGRERQRRRRFFVVLLALGVGVLGCEGLLRWFLFSDLARAHDWGARFRDPGLYFPEARGDDFNELRYLLFSDERRARIDQVPQAEFGWITADFDGVTLRHDDEQRLAGRRPVLLFGSSYAACWHPGDGCFEQLLESSELGRDFCLLNYAVPAYGLDQALLLAERVVPRFAALDPIVVLGFVTDTDLARLQLRFFQAPKPRFVEHDGGFDLLALDELDPLAFIARHPPAIRSYLWRYLACGAQLAPAWLAPAAEVESSHAERIALERYCLGRWHDELAAAGRAHFVLLFHSPEVFPPRGSVRPDERALLQFLRTSEIPCVNSRAVVEAELQRTGVGIEELYQHDPPDMWHPNERGTAVLFRALELGLERRYDEPPRRSKNSRPSEQPER